MRPDSKRLKRGNFFLKKGLFWLFKAFLIFFLFLFFFIFFFFLFFFFLYSFFIFFHFFNFQIFSSIFSNGTSQRRFYLPFMKENAFAPLRAKFAQNFCEPNFVGSFKASFFKKFFKCIFPNDPRPVLKFRKINDPA